MPRPCTSGRPSTPSSRALGESAAIELHEKQAFWESSPSGASLEKLAALVRLPNACTSHPQRPYIPGFHNFAVDHDLMAPAELHSHSPCKHTDGTVIPPCEHELDRKSVV